KSKLRSPSAADVPQAEGELLVVDSRKKSPRAVGRRRDLRRTPYIVGAREWLASQPGPYATLVARRVPPKRRRHYEKSSFFVTRLSGGSLLVIGRFWWKSTKIYH